MLSKNYIILTNNLYLGIVYAETLWIEVTASLGLKTM